MVMVGDDHFFQHYGNDEIFLQRSKNNFIQKYSDEKFDYYGA
jgi:hypothetical protein